MILLFCAVLWTVVCIVIFHNNHRKKCSNGLSIDRYGGGCNGLEAKTLERLTAKSRMVVRSIATTPVGTRITTKWDGKIHQLVQHTERPAVSTNKKSIRLCLGDPSDDDNKYMFIVLHELAHLGTRSVGHTQEFWDTFATLLGVAESQGVWSSDAHDPADVICGKEIGGVPM